ncbi:MAG: ATP-binding protein [Methanoregula sp.]|jgi:serine/threonine-protein kinase RsbW
MDQSFDMTIGSDISEIPLVSARLEDAMGADGFSPEEILDTQLAVEEVITNIIVHGYKKTGSEIRLSSRFTVHGIVIQVTDSAPEFDPLSLPEPDLGGDIDDRKIGGLGIYLVRQVMDEISYRYENGKNVLTMEKRRSA